jgi:hypothetical protein
LEQSKEVYKKEYRKITVKTTDGDILKGRVNIGIKTRVADLFTRSDEPFIVLSDVHHQQGAKKVLFVNKTAIVWVEPQDD